MANGTSTVSYEDLAHLEEEFNDVDLEIICKQYALTKPLYAKRKALISSVPNFWPLVFEQSPPDVDQYIRPSDSAVFADCLKSFEVSRFELDDASPQGHPQSVALRFEFASNEWFENAVLEKKFWFRRARDGWSGLVSEPVGIRWKKGKDLTKGLTDAAVKLWKVRSGLGQAVNGSSREDKEAKLPEYQALMKKVEMSDEGAPSFFTFFGFVSSRRYVSADESAEANKAEAERRERRKNGEKVEDVRPRDEEDDFDREVEVFPFGDELATVLVEDIWPGAIKYFTNAQEAGDEEMSELDFEEEDQELDDASDDEEADKPVDIRGLVHNKNKESSKGTKRRRSPS